MQPEKIITGADENEIWERLKADLDPDMLEYQVVLEQADRKVVLDIDIDPGGGFESGYATTRFLAILRNNQFQLSVYRQNILAEAGKLFGLQDVEVGYKEIDKNFIVKTNNEALAKTIFEDYTVRSLFESLEDLELNTTEEKTDDGTETFLELLIEDGITDADQLQKIYEVFLSVIMTIDEN